MADTITVDEEVKRVGPKNDPKIKKKIIKLRTEKNMKYKDIANKVSKEFDVNMKPDEVSQIYKAEYAKATLVSGRGAKAFSKQIDEATERFNDVCQTVDRLHNAAKKLLDEFEANSETEMEAYIRFLKAAPTILLITRQIKEQIEFLQKEQEKIKLERKSVIFSTAQINEEVNKLLKVLVREGKIEIKSPDLDPNYKLSKGGK